jgi:ABC-type lipoprotein export system ATPase subunit
MLKSFKIEGLFGTTSVDIPLAERGIKILIGENGLGKTTVLSILYYSLVKNFRRLFQYEFDSVELVFSSGDKATVHHHDLGLIAHEPRHPHAAPSIMRFLETFPQEKLNEIHQAIRDSSLTRENFHRHPLLKNYFDVFRRYPPSSTWSALCSIEEGELLLSKKLNKYTDIIDKNLQGISILYFPTYRRIEEELKNLNIDIGEEAIRSSSEKLIQFGMDDVKTRFKSIRDEIQKLSSIGLSRISSEILSQLVKGAPQINEFQLDTMNPDNIKIILARVGPMLSQDDKESIIQTIKNKKLKKEDRFLVYFIQKLIEVYDQQKSLDDKIKSFIEVCNQYLLFSNKKLFYNESEVEFYIESKFFKMKSLMDFLSKLSSGEKQIISLFSKIYLSEQKEQFVILFDEPELSLSVYWQELLLPDIIKSGRIKNLLAATHSPFIYDNELRDCANGLSEYATIKRVE